MSWVKLDENNKIVPVESPKEITIQQVARTILKAYTVSTVVLPFDHGCEYTPLYFETMLFANKKEHILDEYQTRCATYEEALEMHRAGIGYALELEKKRKDCNMDIRIAIDCTALDVIILYNELNKLIAEKVITKFSVAKLSELANAVKDEEAKGTSNVNP